MTARLRDFEGDLEFLTSFELKNEQHFAQNLTSPVYMMDLYTSMETGEDRVHPSAEEVEAIVDSDTVRSFAADIKGKKLFFHSNILEACSEIQNHS